MIGIAIFSAVPVSWAMGDKPEVILQLTLSSLIAIFVGIAFLFRPVLRNIISENVKVSVSLLSAG